MQADRPNDQEAVNNVNWSIGSPDARSSLVDLEIKSISFQYQEPISRTERGAIKSIDAFLEEIFFANDTKLVHMIRWVVFIWLGKGTISSATLLSQKFWPSRNRYPGEMREATRCFQWKLFMESFNGTTKASISQRRTRGWSAQDSRDIKLCHKLTLYWCVL